MPYSAFISYSHTADSALATALQSALHRFAKPWYKLRAVHIFRDQTNLAVNPALWSSIRDALDQSSFFILFASPEAAASQWVAQEADYWTRKNGASHVLIVLTGGTLQWNRSEACFTPESTNALPAALLRFFPEEPLFIDLRWARESGVRLSMGEPRFHEAVLQLASTLHNRPKDELDGADIRMRRRARLTAASALMAILLIALFAWRQTHGKHEETILNVAHDIALSSTKVLAEGPDRARESALLAIESNRLSPSFEGNQALRAAASLLPAGVQFDLSRGSDPSERVRDMAFSPDGGRVAVARDDGSTQVFDIVNRKSLAHFAPAEPVGPTLEVPSDIKDASLDNNAAVSLAFDSTGSLLAAAARNGVVRIWSLPGGKELLVLLHDAPFSQVAFRPGGNRGVNQEASHRGEQVLTASDDGHVRLIDIASRTISADFKCPSAVVSASFSPDGNVVAALSSGGVVSIFDVTTGKLLRALRGGETGFKLAFSGDGQRLAASTGDFAFVWDVSSGRELLKATHAASTETLTPQQWIVDVAVSPDGKFLTYAARGDSLVRVWNIDTGRQVLELRHDKSVAAVAFNKDGTRLGSGSYDGTARVWEFPSGREMERSPHGEGSEVVTFSADGKRFAAGGMDGSVSVSESSRTDRPFSFELPGAVRSVAFSPDGGRFAIGAISARHHPLVRIAQIDGKVLNDIELKDSTVVDSLFFIDSNRLISQWSNRLFSIDVEHSSATRLSDLPGEKRLDPSGRVFAVQRDGVIRIYALPDLQQIASLNDPVSDERRSNLLRTAGEGKFLAFEARKPPNEFAVDIWNVAGKARVSHVLMPADLTRVALDSTGKILFTAQHENLQVWEIPSGKQKFQIMASDDIDRIITDPSSAAFATLSGGRLTVWDAHTGARLSQLPGANFHAAAFSPDARWLIAGYDDHSAALWLWRTKDLQDQACARITSNFSREEWARWFPKQTYRQTCPSLPAVR
jgi:WD40 repeat protein